jgi:TonB family protein
MKKISFYTICILISISCNSKKVDTSDSNNNYQNDTSNADFNWPPTDPTYPGGVIEMMKFIKENSVYPHQALQDSIEGKVHIQFTINEDGSISEIMVLKSSNQILSEECIRLIKQMPNWIPSEFKGEKVKSKYMLPITFCLTHKTGCVISPSKK